MTPHHSLPLVDQRSDGDADDFLFQDGKMVRLSVATPRQPESDYPHPNPIYYVLDASKDPKQINLIDDSRYAEWGGVTYLAGIYRLEADRLTICAAGPYHGRPSDFVLDDEQQRSMVGYQRVDVRER